MMNRSSIDSHIYVWENACWTYTICSWGIDFVVFVKRALIIEGGRGEVGRFAHPPGVNIDFGGSGALTHLRRRRPRPQGCDT